mgnify:CR=1 FL=1|jgi:hypothetical protein
MPFVITCLLAPLCLCMAVYRLLSIPMRLHSGALKFQTERSRSAAALAALAYLALLGYTVWLGHGVLSGLPYQVSDIAQIVRLVLFFEAYPMVYVLAEWRFFYGLQHASDAAPTPRLRTRDRGLVPHA